MFLFWIKCNSELLFLLHVRVIRVYLSLKSSPWCIAWGFLFPCVLKGHVIHLYRTGCNVLEWLQNLLHLLPQPYMSQGPVMSNLLSNSISQNALQARVRTCCSLTAECWNFVWSFDSFSKYMYVDSFSKYMYVAQENQWDFTFTHDFFKLKFDWLIWVTTLCLYSVFFVLLYY